MLAYEGHPYVPGETQYDCPRISLRHLGGEQIMAAGQGTHSPACQCCSTGQRAKNPCRGLQAAFSNIEFFVAGSVTFPIRGVA